MAPLADEVLPLIRTRADVWRYGTANRHGVQMHLAVDRLEGAFGVDDPAAVYAVAHKALASALSVIKRADDSSGIIGDACRRLIALHPRAAAAANVSPTKLVDWMIKFQFESEVDYFELDPVAYADALGPHGVTTYRERLQAIRDQLGVQPARSELWSSPNGHDWFTLSWNAKRLAVLDRDVDAVITTHLGDGKVAAWYEETARALEEIGEPDLAIQWAKRATDFGRGHQSLQAAGYWCQLLAQHHPEQELPARQEVFRRWPSSSTASRLRGAAGNAWPQLEPDAMTRLSSEDPRGAVLFAMLDLDDTQRAWDLAHLVGLKDAATWSELVKKYQKVDALAVLPVQKQLVLGDLEVADARNYRAAARRLATMRELSRGTAAADEVDQFIAELRDIHRRRPRLQAEFTRARLP